MGPATAAPVRRQRRQNGDLAALHDANGRRALGQWVTVMLAKAWAYDRDNTPKE